MIACLPPPHIDREGLEPIPIFISADEQYARYVTVVIASIMEQTQHAIAFHILDCGITQYTKTILITHVQYYSRASIDFHCIPIDHIHDFPTPLYFSLATYARFYIADCIPTIDKAVYIDVDICVHGDIAEIFAYDLGEYGLGAVSDDTCNTYIPLSHLTPIHKQNIGISSHSQYFNAGILLINCTYWRTHNIRQQCIQLMLQDTSHKLQYLDQDVLNIVFQNAYTILPTYYNIFSNMVIEERKAHIKQDLKSHTCMIIHFTSAKKPWNSPQEEIYLSEVWWKYAKLTPFYTDFMTELLAIQTKQLFTAAKRIYTSTLYQRIRAYIKYKFTFGQKRKQYKEEYRLYTVSMEEFIQRTAKH